jgi:hydroxypyruvate reductase
MRDTIMSIGRAAIAAVDPATAVQETVSLDGDGIRIGRVRVPAAEARRVIVLGAGKASPRMAAALVDILGDRVDGGLVITKDGYQSPAGQVEIVEAGHPVPDVRGQEATRRLLAAARDAREGDLVLCVISGGGSALTPSPPEGIDLSELQDVTDQLLRSGATINQMNAVRKHLSEFHGGLLAAAAAPARVIGLLVSDVVGNPVDVIASGPTSPDPTTFADALAALDAFDLRASAPASIRDRLEAGARGELSETPQPEDSVFERVSNVVIADNARAGLAAAAAAESAGLHAQFVTSRVQGEAREIAKLVAGAAIDIARSGRPVRRPGCAIFGGETTVTVRGEGRGGRSQELAVAAAEALAGEPNTAVFALATDGTDGPTDACGGLIDWTTLDRARAAGGDCAGALAANDSYNYLQCCGDLVRLGPTGTNVNDLYMAFGW